ncbi:unnamed protein product [Trichogramma brassicae]|uniref:CIDE-N domain-containing protein n=1 Tax=Trichogramma brassicae TaxID=86971 RepID=A0A6H5IG47_9HYME|nr:unnamed protein product [Trichogramma brassicae]
MSKLIAEYYRRLMEPKQTQLKGFKVTDVRRTRKVGVTARNLQELKKKTCLKLDRPESDHFPAAAQSGKSDFHWKLKRTIGTMFLLVSMPSRDSDGPLGIDQHAPPDRTLASIPSQERERINWQSSPLYITDPSHQKMGPEAIWALRRLLQFNDTLSKPGLYVRVSRNRACYRKGACSGTRSPFSRRFGQLQFKIQNSELARIIKKTGEAESLNFKLKKRIVQKQLYVSDTSEFLKSEHGVGKQQNEGRHRAVFRSKKKVLFFIFISNRTWLIPIDRESICRINRATYVYIENRLNKKRACDSRHVYSRERRAAEPAGADVGREARRAEPDGAWAAPDAANVSVHNGEGDTGKIIVAPLHCKEKDAKLPSSAEFATGTLEDKLERLDGLIRGLGQFIQGKSNLHKEVISYQQIRQSALRLCSRAVQPASGLQRHRRASHATPKRHAVTPASKQHDENNNEVGDQDGFVLVDRRHHRQRKQTAATPGAVHARQQPKPRPVQRRARHRPDVIVIKAKDASKYADILRSLKSDPTLQQKVGSSVNNIRRSAAGALMLQLKKGVENASDLGEELGKVLGTAATASALLHTSTIEIKDLDECATKEEVTAALDALLGVPVSKRDPVKSLRKAYAGTQVAVVALPDDLAATALKLGHVRIGWVNCRIRAREEGGCALLPLLEPWSRGRSLQGSRPHGALLPMRPKGPPSKGLQRQPSSTSITARLPRTCFATPSAGCASTWPSSCASNTRTLLHPTHGSPMPTAKQLSGCMEEFRCRSAQREYIPTSRGPESAEFFFFSVYALAKTL